MDILEETNSNETLEAEDGSVFLFGDVLQEKNFTLFDLIVVVAVTTGVLLTLLAFASFLSHLTKNKHNFELGGRPSAPRYPAQRRPSCIYGYGCDRERRKQVCCDWSNLFTCRRHCATCDSSSTLSSVGEGHLRAAGALHDISSASGKETSLNLQKIVFTHIKSCLVRRHHGNRDTIRRT